MAPSRPELGVYSCSTQRKWKSGCKHNPRAGLGTQDKPSAFYCAKESVQEMIGACKKMKSQLKRLTLTLSRVN